MSTFYSDVTKSCASVAGLWGTSAEIGVHAGNMKCCTENEK